MGRSFLYTLFMYCLVFSVAYIPQIIANISSVRAWLDSAEPFRILYIDFSSIIVIVVIIFILIFIGFIGSHISNNNIFISIYSVIAIIIFVMSMILFSFKVVFIVNFHPEIIPILLSSIIGVIGSFIVSCFIQPYCYGRMKYIRSEFRKNLG